MKVSNKKRETPTKRFLALDYNTGKEICKMNDTMKMIEIIRNNAKKVRLEELKRADIF